MKPSDNVHPALVALPRPTGWFGSDNQSGAHPTVLDAIQRANSGYVTGYGDDPYTESAHELFRDPRLHLLQVSEKRHIGAAP